MCIVNTDTLSKQLFDLVYFCQTHGFRSIRLAAFNLLLNVVQDRRLDFMVVKHADRIHIRKLDPVLLSDGTTKYILHMADIPMELLGDLSAFNPDAIERAHGIEDGYNILRKPHGQGWLRRFEDVLYAIDEFERLASEVDSSIADHIKDYTADRCGFLLYRKSDFTNWVAKAKHYDLYPVSEDLVRRLRQIPDQKHDDRDMKTWWASAVLTMGSPGSRRDMAYVCAVAYSRFLEEQKTKGDNNVIGS